MLINGLGLQHFRSLNRDFSFNGDFSTLKSILGHQRFYFKSRSIIDFNVHVAKINAAMRIKPNSGSILFGISIPTALSVNFQENLHSKYVKS